MAGYDTKLEMVIEGLKKRNREREEYSLYCISSILCTKTIVALYVQKEYKE